MRILFVPLLALLAVGLPVCAQPVGLPPGTITIDGAKDPGSISDAIALRMFFAMAAPKAGSSSAKRPESLAAFLAQLHTDDANLVLNRIANWGAKYNTPNQYTAEDKIAAAEAELLLMRASLTQPGWNTLQAELKRRKANITVYQVPASAMAHK